MLLRVLVSVWIMLVRPTAFEAALLLVGTGQTTNDDGPDSSPEPSDLPAPVAD